VLTITDEQGRQVRRMDVDKAPGLRRVTWNLRADPPAPGGAGQPGAATPAGRGGQPGAATPAGRGGQPPPTPQVAAQFGGGRGGGAGVLAAPGRYTATLGKQVGDSVTPIGPPQTFRVTSIQPQ
jgi:hypothetical protein